MPVIESPYYRKENPNSAKSEPKRDLQRSGRHTTKKSVLRSTSRESEFSCREIKHFGAEPLRLLIENFVYVKLDCDVYGWRGQDNLRMRKVFGKIVILFFALVCLQQMIPARTHAQTKVQWSPPVRIPDYSADARPPFMVADQNQVVHAFTPQVLHDVDVITYRQWTLTQDWTSPNDILVARRPRLMGAFLDKSGDIHLIYATGDELSASIDYVRAPAVFANRALSWSSSVRIGGEANSPFAASLSGDDKGNLYVVYHGRSDDIGLYFAYSSDAGDTWSEPKQFFYTYSDTLWPFAIKTTIDSQGQLHVVWTVVNDSGNGVVIWYARLEAEHQTWSTPIELALAEGYEADWASISENDGKLIVVYQNSGPATRWYRASEDGGHTWQRPIRPFQHVGEYGHIALVTDSAGSLHALLGNRLNEKHHGMWYSRWNNSSWSGLQPVIEGPLSRFPDKAFDPTAPQAVVVQGNVILVTWMTDPAATGDAGDGVWYSYGEVDAPELPLVALPIPTAVPLPSPTATAISLSSTPTPTSDVSDFDVEQNKLNLGDNPALPIVAGVIPVSFLIVVFTVYHRRKRRF